MKARLVKRSEAEAARKAAAEKQQAVQQKQANGLRRQVQQTQQQRGDVQSNARATFRNLFRS